MDQLSGSQLLDWAETRRREVGSALDCQRQAELSQYFTPLSIATLMASMIAPRRGSVRVLDPGSGTGVLAAAAVARLVEQEQPPTEIEVVAYELDVSLAQVAAEVLQRAQAWAEARNVRVTVDVRNANFLEDSSGFSLASSGEFDVAILNPPYGKIGRGSTERACVRYHGVEVPNKYAAFLAVSVALAAEGGDVVAITPRSFCNGTYFRDFRRWLLTSASVERLHVFDSRRKAFQDDLILQETLISHWRVGQTQSDEVAVTAQHGPSAPVRKRLVSSSRVVQPSDPESFIHVVPDARSDAIAEHMASLTHTLGDLGVTASTGRVVDFRSRDLLASGCGPGLVPLLYPHNVRDGGVDWPRGSRKPQALRLGDRVDKLLVPDGDYVLVKRFSAKEERRRVSASWLPKGQLGHEVIGFENHLNYLHQDGAGLEQELAIGLATFLNSSLVDDYLRQFSGHTQVNAGDLRSLRYPSPQELKELGAEVDPSLLGSQGAVDELVESLIARPIERDTYTT